MSGTVAWRAARRRKDRLIETVGWCLSCAVVTTALAGVAYWVDRRAGAEAGLESAIILELDPLPPVTAVPSPPPSAPTSPADLPAAPPEPEHRSIELPRPEGISEMPPEAPLSEPVMADKPPIPFDPPPETTVAAVADPALAGARPRKRPEAARPVEAAAVSAKSSPPQAAEVASAGPQSAAASRAGAEDAAAQWGAAIRKRVERRKAYPKAARGAEGEVVVRMTISRAGTLETVAVSRSSGNAVLDDAALAAVRRAGRFPAAPSSIDGARHVFSLPIRFSP